MLAKATAALAMATLAIAVAAPGSVGSRPAPAGAQTMNHAAVVVDTGDGQVRRFCLAFPEAELDGIEVLRRVDTRPYRFETFGSKGAGVCMLCGVGCPSGDCFCDPGRFWAYHRAGPGGEPYQTSRVGASSTSVRNGDVEGWKWGKGEAPPAATVSEVCGVPEPPRRTAAATTTSTSEPAPTTSSTPTTSPPEESPPPTPTPPAPKISPQVGAPAVTSTPGSPASTTTIPPDTPAAGAGETFADEAAAPSAAQVERSLGAEDEGAAAPSEIRSIGSIGTITTIGAFTALLGGLLVWRARLRRAKVRSVTPVR